MKKLVLCAASVLAMVAAVPALAQNVNYSLTGTFTGTIGATNFNTTGSLLGIGSQSSPQGRLTSFQVILGGVTYTPTDGVQFFNSGGIGVAGFTSLATNGGDIFDVRGLAANYNGSTALAPTSVTNAFPGITYPSFVTDRGIIAFTGGTNLLFSNVITATPPVVIPSVPELATWGLMLAGFGLVGAGLRVRRRNTTVTYA